MLKSLDELIKKLKSERSNLYKKLSRLNGFIGSYDFTRLNETNQDLLKTQAIIMKYYIDILTHRINYNIYLKKEQEQKDKEIELYGCNITYAEVLEGFEEIKKERESNDK